MENAQKKLQELSDELQKLQTDMNTSIQARQKLESQQQENLAVQREFATLDDDSNIYKIVGPVLLKQEKAEATMAVDGRLQYIEKEIQRIEKQLEDIRQTSDKTRIEMYQIQSQLQAAQPVPGAS